MTLKRILVERVPGARPGMHHLPGIRLVPASVFANMLGVGKRTLYNYELRGIVTPAKRINGRKYWEINERPRFDDPASTKRRLVPKPGAKDGSDQSSEDVQIGSIDTPCKTCHFSVTCSTQELACKRFQLFMDDVSSEEWQRAEARPTKELFARIFGEEATDA